jgi:hypothetical protein
MERQITRVSYWLGLACVAIALVMRGFNAIGFWIPGNVIQGVTIWYMSFYKGALLFLLVPIAAANYNQIKSRNH